MSAEIEESPEKQEEFWDQPFTGYEIKTILGYGNSGTVLLARDLRFDRDMVIKTIIPDLENNEDAAERFFNEARQVARLRHKNIARALDCGRAGKYFYFAMEYVRGESVKSKLERLQTGKLKELDTLHLVRDAAEALQYMFESALVHRDIKPSNMMITNKDGSLKITDFGVTKEIAFSSQEAKSKSVAAYVSPEEAGGDPNTDIRADLYSLGCVWYEMLLGRPPFVAESPSIVLTKHISDDPQPPHEVDPRITPATGQLIMWLLGKDREQRPRTPQLFLSKMTTHPLIKLELEKKAEEEAKAAALEAEKNEDADEMDEDDISEENPADEIMEE